MQTRHCRWSCILLALAIVIPSVALLGCEPLATFTATPRSGLAPLAVQFADESTTPGCLPFTSRVWDFGNSDTSTDANPSRTYEQPGTYPVSLTVTTEKGSDTVTEYIFVHNGEGPGVKWTQAVGEAPCALRVVVFDNKLWMIGTFSLTEERDMNEVWYSADGTNWSLATAAAPWTAREGHTAVAFDNKLWILGGDADGAMGDVWYSEDGEHWTEATDAAPWGPRDDHTSVVFDGKIWVIAGAQGNGAWPLERIMNDAWYSEDGVNWSLAAANAAFPARLWHASVVFDGKIWVMGGRTEDERPGVLLNDVWSSPDGVNWTQATANASWEPRLGQPSAVFDNKLWVIGGSTSTDFAVFDDVWFSENGTDWIQATDAAPWGKLTWHAAPAFGDKLWVIGGATWTDQDGWMANYVWYSP